MIVTMIALYHRGVYECAHTPAVIVNYNSFLAKSRVQPLSSSIYILGHYSIHTYTLHSKCHVISFKWQLHNALDFSIMLYIDCTFWELPWDCPLTIRSRFTLSHPSLNEELEKSNRTRHTHANFFK